MGDFNVLKENQEWRDKNFLTLDELLDEVTVMTCDEMVDDFKESEKMFQINTLLSGWFAVADVSGINAYCSTEKEAYAYRLFLINRVING